MTPGRMLRPVLVGLAMIGGGLLTASCGAVETDGVRFESLAQQVAAINLGAADARPEGASSKPTRLQVEVMDPHDLWDARDGGLKGLIERTSIRTAEAAAPVVAEAVVQEASSRIADHLAPAPVAAETPIPVKAVAEVSGATLQLGAYSSPDAARAAWQAITEGQASEVVRGLSPRFETVQVNGRALTRLKVSAPTDRAGAICDAVASSDRWCARRA